MAEPGPDISTESLVGLWRRDRIEFSDGRADSTTKVYWGQTRSFYIDIRIPVSASALVARASLDEYGSDERLALAGQKGFGGRIRLSGNRCEWIRLLDYQPASGRPDIADIELDGDVLYEKGDAGSVVGSSYHEIFRRISRGSQVCVAAQLIQSSGLKVRSFSSQGCLLVLLDDCFLFAEPRHRALPPATNLAYLVAEADHLLACSYLDCEYSFGSIANDGSAWTIALSTLPFRIGRRLFPTAIAARHGDGQELSLDLPEGGLQWRIVESNLPPAALANLFLL